MKQENASISVVVRTRDVESYFPELLRSLALQTLKPSELVIVDNYSTKKEAEKLKKVLEFARKSFFNNALPIKLVLIADKDFSHAFSTNAGVSVSSSELVCITNGHSLPSSRSWLESGARHFRNQLVAGVGGYTTPHKNGTFWEKLFYGWTWRKLNEKSKRYMSDSYFSTTNCLLRRALWEKYPFDESLSDIIMCEPKFGGEDYDWSREMLARGYEIVVEPKFCVYHSHGENLPTLFSKYSVWREIRKRIGLLERPRKSFTRLNSANLDWVSV
ncbi:MAG: glycosyltransferase [Candidatus Bathyarchaeia archaeon]